LIHRLGRYLGKLGLINRVSQKGVSRLGVSGISSNGKESGDYCQGDEMQDFFIHRFLWFFAVILPAPDSPLESVQQLCFS
jgi:hypothetical protein